MLSTHIATSSELRTGVFRQGMEMEIIQYLSNGSNGKLFKEARHQINTEPPYLLS